MKNALHGFTLSGITPLLMQRPTRDIDGEIVVPARMLQGAMKSVRTIMVRPSAKAWQLAWADVTKVSFLGPCAPLIFKGRTKLVVVAGRERRTWTQYEDWRIEIAIRARDSVQIEALERFLSAAGSLIGIGTWRPEGGGSHGTFRVERLAEARLTDVERRCARALDERHILQLARQLGAARVN